MKYIGIINCFKSSHKCTGSGCFKAFYNKDAAFEIYTDEEIRMMSFTHCNGCSENSVENVVEIGKKMKGRGVDVIHLSSCVRSKCPHLENFKRALSKELPVVEYTHKKKKKRD